jgi:NADPH:quinone reductase
MKAVQVNEFGTPNVLKIKELPDPIPGNGEVLIGVCAAGVTPLDTYVREQSHGAPTPSLPYIPGFEATGEIASLGEGVTKFKIGDRVYANPFLGAYSELLVHDAASVYSLPDSISFTQGTTIANSYPTAYYALFNLAHAQAGDRIFVHGASGAVGTAAVELAKAAGMTVVGTAGSDRGLELVQQQGAHYVLNHRESNYLQQALELTEAKGYDVILEMNASKKLADDVSLVGTFGRIIVIGGTDASVTFDPTPILWKGASIIGLYIGLTTPEESAQIHSKLYTQLQNNALRPIVGQEFALADVVKAHEAVHQSSSAGKIVLTF